MEQSQFRLVIAALLAIAVAVGAYLTIGTLAAVLVVVFMVGVIGSKTWNHRLGSRTNSSRQPK